MSGMADWQAKISIDIDDLKKRIKVAEGELDKATKEDRKIKLDLNTKTLENAIQKLDRMLDSLGKGTGDFKQFENLSKELSVITSEVQSFSKAFGKVNDSGAKTLLSSIQNIDKSLSELSQHILNVNKNMSNMGGNTNGAVKQVESIGNAAAEAVKQVDKLADAQSKLGNKTNISLGDTKLDNAVSTAKELDKTLEQVDIPTDSFDKVLSKLNLAKSELVDIVKITKQSVSGTDGKFHTSYTLKDSRGSTEIYGENSKTDRGQLLRSNIVGYDKKKDELNISKEQLEVDKQLVKEEENLAKAQQKKVQAFLKEEANYENKQKKAEFIKKQTAAYDELTNTISKYSEVAKRVAGGKAEDGDLELMTKLEDKISQLQKQPILFDSEVAKSEKMLVSLYNQLDKIEKKTAETNRVNQANAVQTEWDKNVKAIQKYMDAVTKLNNLKASDKGTGKKSEQIALQEQEVEKLKTTAYEARANLSSMVNSHTADISTWNKWLDVMQQFDNASNGSAESVAKLKDALRNVKESTLNSVQSNIDSYKKVFDKYSNATSPTTKSTEYSDNLSTLQNAISKLEEYKDKLTGVSEITETQRNQIKQYENECEKAADALKSMSAAERGVKDISLEKFLQRANKDLQENTRYSAEAKAAINALIKQAQSGDPSINIEKMTTELIKLENQEIAAGRAGKSLWDIFKTKSTYGFIGQMQSYLSMYIGFYGMINGAKSAVSTIVQLDDALVDLKKTTSMNSSELENFYYDSNSVAKQMGVTTQEIIDQASAWSRLGFSSAEASTQMSKLSAQFAAISPGMDIDTATDGLVSTMKAFDIDVQDVQREVMDNINKIGNTAATSNDEIVDMLTRSSAAMSAANNTLEETIALETAAVEITRSAETTGTAFKTLSMRLRGYDEETESYTGDVEELSGAIADLTKTASSPGGISLFTDDTKQTYKSTYQLLKEISQIYDQLSDKNQADICLYVQKCA